VIVFSSSDWLGETLLEVGDPSLYSAGLLEAVVATGATTR